MGGPFKPQAASGTTPSFGPPQLAQGGVPMGGQMGPQFNLNQFGGNQWAQGFAQQLANQRNLYGLNSAQDGSANSLLQRLGIQIPGADWKLNDMWGNHPTGGNFVVPQGPVNTAMQ